MRVHDAIMPDYAAGAPAMTEAERIRISAFIEKEFGIRMPASKKSMLEGRLAKRLRATGCASYGEYFDFATRLPEGRDEFLFFADLVSTHETSFFREPGHFELLASTLLPALCAQGARGRISALSAACSTGEEAWTLAMLIDSGLARMGRGEIDFSVEGIDISTKAISIAAHGVYPLERANSIPADLKRSYLMISKDRSMRLVRFVPELRSSVYFHAGNLFGDMALERGPYDIVFCRNALIYFDATSQREAILALLRHMRRGAYLFLGHSETLRGLEFPMRSVAHAVYQKD